MVHDLSIVDAQVHVWAPDSPHRPWPASAIIPHRDRAYSPDDLLADMDEAGVDRALLVPPTWEGPRNDLVRSAIDAHPDRFAGLLRVDPTNPRTVAAVGTFRAAGGSAGLARTNIVGVRLSMTQGDWRPTLRAADEAGFFRAMEHHRVPLSLYMPGGLPEFADLATRYPELPITVDHLALDRVGPPLDGVIAPLLELARFPNVAVKASALPCFVDEGFPFPSIGRAVTLLVGAYGSQRVFWGSDLTRLPCRYGELVAAFIDHMPDLTTEELADVMGRSLVRWLDW